MASKIKQLRFPGIDLTNWDQYNWSDNLLQNLGKVTQLSIYALPGTTFKINQNGNITGETLVINGSGKFNIDLADRPISDLRINKISYDNITNANHCIIIDLIYEGGIVI